MVLVPHDVVVHDDPLCRSNANMGRVHFLPASEPATPVNREKLLALPFAMAASNVGCEGRRVKGEFRVNKGP